MIRLKEKVVVLSADSKPWEMEGRTGISHRARFLMGNEIYPVRCTESQVSELNKVVGKAVEVVVDLVAPKENTRLEFVQIV